MNHVTFKSVDWLAERDAVARAAGASWWDWSDGSCLLFLRWPKWYQKTALEGMPVFYTKRLEHYMAYQPDEVEDIKAKQGEKLNNVSERHYIALIGNATQDETTDPVKSWTFFFAVLKGHEDILMVHDASKKSGSKSVIVVNLIEQY
jgi:hypothetical protein